MDQWALNDNCQNKTLKMDRRALKTESRIKDAFYQLLEQYRLRDITIKMICDKADIERKTFYLHYKDKYMLTDVLLKEHLLHALVVNDENNGSLEDRIKIILTFFDRDRTFFKRLFEGQGSYPLRKHLIILLRDRLQQMYDFNYNQTTLYFVVTGIVGTLELYIRGKIGGSVGTIANQMATLIKDNLGKVPLIDNRK